LTTWEHATIPQQSRLKLYCARGGNRLGSVRCKSYKQHT